MMIKGLKRRFAAYTQGVAQARSMADLFPIEGKEYDLSKISEMTNTMQLKSWQLNEEESRVTMTREFQFENFRQSMLFINTIALLADRIDHHPEWFNVYNRVDVLYSSHWCNSMAYKDFISMRVMDQVYQQVSALEQVDEFSQSMLQEEELFGLFESYLGDL